MKRFILILSLIIFGANAGFCYEPDYRQIYMDMPVPDFSYIHGIDPGQYYDNKNAAYSVYPLFKLCSPVFFKTIAINIKKMIPIYLTGINIISECCQNTVIFCIVIFIITRQIAIIIRSWIRCIIPI